MDYHGTSGRTSVNLAHPHDMADSVHCVWGYGFLLRVWTQLDAHGGTMKKFLPMLSTFIISFALYKGLRDWRYYRDCKILENAPLEHAFLYIANEPFHYYKNADLFISLTKSNPCTYSEHPNIYIFNGTTIVEAKKICIELK